MPLLFNPVISWSCTTCLAATFTQFIRIFFFEKVNARLIRFDAQLQKFSLLTFYRSEQGNRAPAQNWSYPRLFAQNCSVIAETRRNLKLSNLLFVNWFSIWKNKFTLPFFYGKHCQELFFLIPLVTPRSSTINYTICLTVHDFYRWNQYPPNSTTRQPRQKGSN